MLAQHLDSDGSLRPNLPIEELDDGEWGGVRCRRGNPVESSLLDVDKVQILVVLERNTGLG